MRPSSLPTPTQNSLNGLFAVAAGNGLSFGDVLQVLDSDAPGAGLVVAGLVGDDHARLERHGVSDFRNPMRAFMHGKIAADAMAGAVVVIDAAFPQ